MSETSLKDYEAILIADPGLNPEALAQLQAQLGEMVTRQGGRVAENILLGKRKLSYKIGRHHEGHYLQAKLQMPPAGMEGLKRAVALTDSVMRMMVVRGTGTPAPVFRPEGSAPEPDV
ncbi:MAG: 30S ribosomal protein S6 [Candidatus Omnitrophica bacterium]|nr:30S ribosomal protein S6 [Candidatus Omnitrophota bacterium]